MKKNGYFRKFESPIGKLVLVASDKELISILFENTKPDFPEKFIEIPNHSILLHTEKQLKEYLSGKRKAFDIPLNLEGTVFQKKVWKELQKIPYGKTISYQELAKRVGSVKKARAVGNANGKNPIPIIIPCHRVIQKNGKLGGFGGGLEIKRFLLELERVKLAKFQ